VQSGLGAYIAISENENAKVLFQFVDVGLSRDEVSTSVNVTVTYCNVDRFLSVIFNGCRIPLTKARLFSNQKYGDMRFKSNAIRLITARTGCAGKHS